MFLYKTIKFKTSTVHLLKYDSYKIDDFMDLLNTDEKQRYTSFKSIKRRYEYLSTRILKEQLFTGKQILYNQYKEPTIEGQKHVSISHCLGYSAIAVSKFHPIGLDIEPLGDKAQRLYSKFLNESECKLLSTSNMVLMTQAWSCKESLFKLSKRSGIIFKRDLLIENYDGDNNFLCKINLSSKRSVCVSLDSVILNKDNLVLTINSSKLTNC